MISEKYDKRIILADEIEDSVFNAGKKARDDVVSILNKLDFETILLSNYNHKKVTRILEILGCFYKCLRINNGIVVLQHPYRFLLSQIISTIVLA